jgi:NADH-quinone oxidoreductase subunit L
MMLAAGLGPIGYAFAIFHLVTHGFFKAGLFLGAGSVMHAMDDSVDMRRFGGLGRLLPVTAITMGLGWLAILGIPPFSGFWSKDRIIEAAFVGEGWRPWVFGLAALIGAGITAFYMSRLFFMTFLGRRRWVHDGEHEPHPHEAPALMRWPMIVLAVGSVALGGLLAIGGAFTTWLEPVTGSPEHHGEPVLPPWLLVVLTLVLVLLGVALAFRLYVVATVPEVAPESNVLVRAARRDLYQDAVNEGVVMLPGQVLTRTLVYADRAAVDSGFLQIAAGVRRWGERTRRFQNGYVRSYAATSLGGLLVVAAVVWALAG